MHSDFLVFAFSTTLVRGYLIFVSFPPYFSWFEVQDSSHNPQLQHITPLLKKNQHQQKIKNKKLEKENGTSKPIILVLSNIVTSHSAAIEHKERDFDLPCW